MQIRFAILLSICLFAGLFALVTPQLSFAATTLPTKMNFQGRITNPTGAILTNGTYNMRFRIWSAASGGTQQWSEDRLVSASQGVVVTNGQFSVQLGSVSGMPASLFASNSLYFEVELPTPASATTSSPVWTEGAMTPRNQLATSAYAYNAETLDGIDSANFAQLTTSNAFSGTISVSGANDASKLLVQTSGAADLFRADTATSTVTIGTAANGAIFSASGVQYTGSTRPLRSVMLAPEYPGATFTAISSNFNGSLSSDFCSGTSGLSVNTGVCSVASDEQSYYSWTTSQATPQDYGIFIRYRIPSDYDTGSMTNLTFAGRGTTSGEVAGIVLYRGATACATLSDVITTANTWTESTVSSPLGSCTINAGDTVTFKVLLTATQNQTARAGSIGFSYRSRF